jgi:hypothetical protein
VSPILREVSSTIMEYTLTQKKKILKSGSYPIC